MRTWERFKKSYLLYSFKRDPIAIISFVVLVVLAGISLLAPVIAPYNTHDTGTFDLMDAEIPPSWMDEGNEMFLLGTDIQGRDLLSTMIYGLRISFLIGIGAVVFQAVVGIVVGLLSGYIGGKLDAFLMRIADIQFAIPYLIVAIFTAAIFKLAYGVGRYEELAVPLLIIIIGISEWPKYARTVRASVLGEKNKEYVEAARVIGISRWRLNIPTSAVLLLARSWTGLSRFTRREPFYPINMAPYVFQDWQVSSEKARRELGFRPTPFVEGAQETLQWYREMV